MRRVCTSLVSTRRIRSGYGTWHTRTCSARKDSSGTRWRVWMIVARRVSVVVRTPVVRVISRRRFTALTLSSLPWSMTFNTSRGPINESVICSPPVPHPNAIGSSRGANGTWCPGMATALSSARRTSRLLCSSRNAKLYPLRRATSKSAARTTDSVPGLGVPLRAPQAVDVCLERHVVRQLPMSGEARGFNRVDVREHELLVLGRRLRDRGVHCPVQHRHRDGLELVVTETQAVPERKHRSAGAARAIEERDHLGLRHQHPSDEDRGAARR